MGGWGCFGPKDSLRLSEIESSTSAEVFPSLNSYLCKARQKAQADPQILPFLVCGSTLASPSLLHADSATNPMDSDTLPF